MPIPASPYFTQNISHSLKGSNTGPGPIKILCGLICSCFCKEVGAVAWRSGEAGLHWTAAAGENAGRVQHEGLFKQSQEAGVNVPKL